MIKTVLIDLDDTIFDFKRCERQALSRSLDRFSIAYDDSVLKVYSLINDGMWKRLEKGEITRAFLRVHRFEVFFAEIGISGIDMELRYYLEQVHEDIVAYEKATEFFVIFNRRDSVWNYMPYSFMVFIHDYIDSIIEIDEKQVLSITKGILPYQRLEEYHNILDFNRSGSSRESK